MANHWEYIKWFFEDDGALRDIYVLDSTISDWEKLIDFINRNHTLKFGEDNANQIDKEYVLAYWEDKTHEMESKSIRIDLKGIHIHSYFFSPYQIEFDIDPKEIKSIKEFETIQKFMVSISKTINKPIILTDENCHEHPWLKIDLEKGIHEIQPKETYRA